MWPLGAGTAQARRDQRIRKRCPRAQGAALGFCREVHSCVSAGGDRILRFRSSSVHKPTTCSPGTFLPLLWGRKAGAGPGLAELKGKQVPGSLQVRQAQDSCMLDCRFTRVETETCPPTQSGALSGWGSGECPTSELLRVRHHCSASLSVPYEQGPGSVCLTGWYRMSGVWHLKAL